MRAGPRLLVGQDVKQKAERSRIERDEDEPPFHYGGFWISGAVDRDIKRANSGQREPGREIIVDRQNEERMHVGLPQG